jgi:hypothetical protein
MNGLSQLLILQILLKNGLQRRDGAADRRH